jgi:hypothetical protein
MRIIVFLIFFIINITISSEAKALDKQRHILFDEINKKYAEKYSLDPDVEIFKKKVPYNLEELTENQLNDGAFYTNDMEPAYNQYRLLHYNQYKELEAALCCISEIDRLLLAKHEALDRIGSQFRYEKITFGDFCKQSKEKSEEFDIKIGYAINNYENKISRQEVEKNRPKKEAESKNENDLSLKDYYMQSMIVTECYTVRQNYYIKYVDQNTHKNILSKMKKIESAFLKNNSNLDKNTLWNEASSEFKNSFGRLMDIARMAPERKMPDIDSLCKLAVITITSYSENTAPIKKNF